MPEEGQGVNPDEGSNLESYCEAERSDEHRTSRVLKEGRRNGENSKLLKILLLRCEV